MKGIPRSTALIQGMQYSSSTGSLLYSAKGKCLMLNKQVLCAPKCNKQTAEILVFGHNTHLQVVWEN